MIKVLSIVVIGVKMDFFNGLKENVIVGKCILVGMGMCEYEDFFVIIMEVYEVYEVCCK